MLISNILKYFVNQYFLDQIKYIWEADMAYTVWDSVLVSVSQGMVQGTPASMSFFFKWRFKGLPQTAESEPPEFLVINK